MSYIFIKVVRKPPFSYFLKCLTEGKPKNNVFNREIVNFQVSRQNFVKTCQKWAQWAVNEQSNSLSTAHMSSQTAYQQPINSLSTAYQQPINSSMSSRWAVNEQSNSLSTAYQQLNEQSMSSPTALQQQYNSTTEQVWGQTQISILNSKSN